MKKVTVLILIIFFVISSPEFTAYSLEIQNNSINEEVFINDMGIAISKVGNESYIKINDLKELGFEVFINKENKQIDIYQNPNLIIEYTKIKDSKTEKFNIANTEYKVNINGCNVEAKKLNDDIVINIDSFIKVKGFDFTKRMDNKYGFCDIYIDNSEGFENSVTKPQKTKINITKKEDYFYSENNKIGLIKDNIEWISLDYIMKLIEVDEIEQEKNNDEMWVHLEKGDYDVEIEVNNKNNATAECENFYMDLIAVPIEIDGKLYIPLVDSIQLFNLEIIRDNDFEKVNSVSENTTGFGNSINGINIIKNNEWIYYININDFESLHRAKQDMSEDTIVINSPINQFYICNNKIFYIVDDYEGVENGLYKANLDGSNKKQIVSGNISFLNISGNELYFCEGSNGGKLCRINKNGKNKEILIETKIIYPSISNGWIYYINKDDNNSIYRFKLDSNYNVKINSRHAKCLNVDNKKVYFSDSEESWFMNHDGSFENRVYKNPVRNILISENNIFWVEDDGIYKQSKENICGEWIYVKCKVRGIGLENDKLKVLQENRLTMFYKYGLKTGISELLNIENGYNIEKIQYPLIYCKKSEGLFKYNVDTKESKMIVPGYCSKICNIIDGWIYYEISGNGLYRVRTDGTNKTKILDENIYAINVDSSGIYYLISQHGMTIEDYCRVNLDGTNKKVLIDDLIADSPFISDVNENYIYYERKDGLHRVKKDGTEKILFVNKRIYDFKMIDDYIFYTCEDGLYSIKSDGSEEKNITEDSTFKYTKYKDSVFYLSENEGENTELYRYNMTNKQTEKVPNLKFSRDSYVDLLRLKDNYLVISVSSEEELYTQTVSVYVVDIETNKISTMLDKIKDCSINRVFINGDEAYYSIEDMKAKLRF